MADLHALHVAKGSPVKQAASTKTRCYLPHPRNSLAESLESTWPQPIPMFVLPLRNERVTKYLQMLLGVARSSESAAETFQVFEVTCVSKLCTLKQGASSSFHNSRRTSTSITCTDAANLYKHCWSSSAMHVRS